MLNWSLILLASVWIPSLFAISAAPPPTVATGRLTRVDFVRWDSNCGHAKIEGEQHELCYPIECVLDHDMWIDLPPQCDGAYNWGAWALPEKQAVGVNAYAGIGPDMWRYGNLYQPGEIGYDRGNGGSGSFTAIEWWCGVESEPGEFTGTVPLPEAVHFSWPSYWDWP
jgi:hypothetical protein